MDEFEYKSYPTLGTTSFLINFTTILNTKDYSNAGIEFQEIPDIARNKYPAIMEHARRWTLNYEQFVPFSICCLKLLCRINKVIKPNTFTSHQSASLLNIQHELFRDDGLRHMLTAGAGSGKSRVLKAYMEFAFLWDCLDRIKVTATTGKAAILLSGSTPGRTYHSVLGFLGKYGKESRVSGKVRSHWKGVWQIIIDEVSMLSAKNFFKIEKRLRHLSDSTKSFGGLDLIVSGDFFQLPPVKAKGIYKPWHILFKSTKVDVEDQEGARLWSEGITTCSYLKNNIRSNESYARLLERFRQNKPTLEDFNLINSRNLSSRVILPPGVEKCAPQNWNVERLNAAAFEEVVC